MAIFLGGMTTIERSESINAFIKWFVSSHINLTQFIEQVIRADMEFDELVLATARTAVYYHNNFLIKEPCRNSPHT